MTSRTAFFFATSLILARTIALAQTDSPLPSDAEIRKILADRVGSENLGIAMVVGVIDAKGRRVVSYGSLAKDDKRPLNGDTIFEIGSMTKVFTSLVLMDMVQKGEVALTDPVAKYLPSTVKVPERNNKKITLQDLSTQSSGLPRMPTNFTPKDPLNPYADYTPEQLYQFLSGYQLTRDIGAQYEYSNLGVGLLGHTLTLRAGTSYEAMVRSRVLDPLEMNHTRVVLTPEMKARLALGHAGTNVVPNWDIATLEGAGALRSSAGVVVLTNLSGAVGPDDIGRHLLDASYPVQKVEPMKEHTEVTVNTKVFDNYVGTFQLAPNAIMTISRDGDQMFGQLIWQPKLEIFPESERKFFLKVVDAQLTFDVDAQGKATQVTLHQNGRDQIAKRIDEAQAAASAAALAKKFKDQTQSPGTEAALRRDIDELRAGQPKYELMSPGLADATRQQLPQIKALIVQMGEVQSITFKGVGPAGADIYEVKFEHGSTEWRIMLDADGKLASAGFRPL